MASEAFIIRCGKVWQYVPTTIDSGYPKSLGALQPGGRHRIGDDFPERPGVPGRTAIMLRGRLQGQQRKHRLGEAKVSIDRPALREALLREPERVNDFDTAGFGI